MKTTVLLIRHGETEWNKLGKFQGSTDIKLSPSGIGQAELLKNRIDGDFDVIYSSPLSRAYETAQILASVKKHEVHIAKDITEINFGKWEGLTLKSISETYPDVFNSWRTDKEEAAFIGGDASTRNASIRASRCVLDIVKKNSGKKIVIVAHGGIIKAALIGIFGWDMTMYHKIAMGNTCINTITFTDELKPAIIGLNDTNHLLEEAGTV